jgi:hypothetical protein
MNTTNRTHRTRHRRKVFAAALTLFAAAAVSLGTLLAGVGGAEAQAGRPAATPEAAVREIIERGGGVYAGDCSETVSPRDIGRTCSKLIGERGDLRAYLVGRTFSEFSTWVFVRRERDGWRTAGTAALDFFAPSLDIPWPP